MKFCPKCKQFVIAQFIEYEEIGEVFMQCELCNYIFTECNQRLAQYDEYGIVMENE